MQAQALPREHDPQSGRELVRLVDDVDGQGLHLVAVLTSVVGAEEKLKAFGQFHAKVRLGATTVTTVQRGQSGEFADFGCSTHLGLLLDQVLVIMVRWDNEDLSEKIPTTSVVPATRFSPRTC